MCFNVSFVQYVANSRSVLQWFYLEKISSLRSHDLRVSTLLEFLDTISQGRFFSSCWTRSGKPLIVWKFSQRVNDDKNNYRLFLFNFIRCNNNKKIWFKNYDAFYSCDGCHNCDVPTQTRAYHHYHSLSSWQHDTIPHTHTVFYSLTYLWPRTSYVVRRATYNQHQPTPTTNFQNNNPSTSHSKHEMLRIFSLVTK